MRWALPRMAYGVSPARPAPLPAGLHAVWRNGRHRGRPLHWTDEFVPRRRLALEDREQAVGDLEDDEGHGGAVLVAGLARPVAVLGLLAEQFLANGGPP